MSFPVLLGVNELAPIPVASTDASFCQLTFCDNIAFGRGIRESKCCNERNPGDNLVFVAAPEGWEASPRREIDVAP
jgi:hypothetical protein